MSPPVEKLVSLLHAKRCGKGWYAKCPAHDDREPSLRIDEGSDGRALVKCFAGCTLDAVLLAIGLTKKDLFPLSTLPKSSGNGEPLRLTPTAMSFDWQKCVDAFTDKHVEQVANWRGFSPDFVRELREGGYIGIYNSLVAFSVHNGKNIVGCHYRVKGGDNWFYFPKGTKAAPLTFGELISGERVNVFESTWDGLDYMHKSGERDGVIIARGAGNAKIAAALIPHGSTAYVWTQNDKPGADFEKELIANTRCTVKRCRIPTAHKDLNDWTRAGATCDDLLSAMLHAEVVREAEKSWIEALNESVITSNELRDLQLMPRRKLFGDWFCEGDLGFIFAFRGVGKTWFALAIAQALSTGGKLGDWTAYQNVKVLYVDGEMPADLMRSRCQGLEAINDHLHFLNHEILFDRTGKALNITNPEVQEAITKRCLTSNVKVVILDNLSTLATGMKENEADSWELVNNWLLDLRRRKIAVVIVHHAGRSGEMRGTSKREDNVFWIIALDDAKGRADDKRGARFISHFTKPSRNTQEEVPAYAWHFVTDKHTGLVTIGHKEAQTLDVFLQLIREGVTENGQLAQEMKVSPATISRLAKKAIDDGKIQKVRREYRLVETAKAAKNSAGGAKK